VRVLYGILAQSALQRIDGQEASAERQAAYFQNLIRLLKMYRYGRLARPSPRAVLDRRQPDIRQLKRDRLDAEAVEVAIRTAHENAYPNVPKDQVVEKLVAVFEQLGKNQHAGIQTDEIDAAKRFLEELAAALRR
jgi:hypothetical protein